MYDEKKGNKNKKMRSRKKIRTKKKKSRWMTRAGVDENTKGLDENSSEIGPLKLMITHNLTIPFSTWKCLSYGIS